MSLLVLNNFQNINKQKEGRRWLGSLRLTSACRETAGRQTPPAGDKHPEPANHPVNLAGNHSISFVARSHRELFSSAQQNTSMSKQTLAANRDKDYMKAFN